MFKDLEIRLEPKYTRLIPEKFSFWASGAARCWVFFYFLFLHPNQCGLIQGFLLGLVNFAPAVPSDFSTFYGAQCCKFGNIDRLCGFYFGEVLFVHSSEGIMQTWDLFYFIFMQRSFGIKC